MFLDLCLMQKELLFRIFICYFLFSWFLIFLLYFSSGASVDSASDTNKYKYIAGGAAVFFFIVGAMLGVLCQKKHHAKECKKLVGPGTTKKQVINDPNCCKFYILLFTNVTSVS